MTSTIWRMFAFATLTLIFLGNLAHFYVLGDSKSDARAAIVDAAARLRLCYDALAQADAAGANITVLIAIISEAGESLSVAELSYKTGDFGSAIELASQVQDKLNGFVVRADALTEKAVQQYYWGFLVTTGGVVAGAVLVVSGSLVVWFLSKRSTLEVPSA